MAAPINRKLLANLCHFQSVYRCVSYRGYSCIRKSVYQLLQQQNIVEKERVKLEGWLRSVKKQKHVTFFHLVDGTTDRHVQVVANPELCHRDLSYGSSVRVEGEVTQSPGRGQNIEIYATRVELVGPCDVQNYPFQPKVDVSSDYARGYLHLRPRTASHGALLRIRNAASMAVHQFFQENDYLFIHTPIITSNDCEGAGESFTVQGEKERKLTMTPSSSSSSPTPATEGQVPASPGLFFDCPAYLTVSGQLHLEAVSGAFKKVYSFGPTFRAENSVGRHHLSEFYMIEGELAFLDDLQPLLHVMEGLVKTVSKVLRTRCEDDVQTLWKSAPDNHANVIDRIISKDFVRMTYSDAIDLLQKNHKTFHFKPKYGCDLQKEHEKFLVQACDHTPVFVTDYPAAIKPFYAKINDGTDTVGAVDLLVPQVGELCGGSLREHRWEPLQARLDTLGLLESLKWYLELRQYGSVPHGGFGMGFERFLQFYLGINNIKDVIPFPRWSHNCDL